MFIDWASFTQELRKFYSLINSQFHVHLPLLHFLTSFIPLFQLPLALNRSVHVYILVLPIILSFMFYRECECMCISKSDLSSWLFLFPSFLRLYIYSDGEVCIHLHIVSWDAIKSAVSLPVSSHVHFPITIPKVNSKMSSLFLKRIAGHAISKQFCQNHSKQDFCPL